MEEVKYLEYLKNYIDTSFNYDPYISMNGIDPKKTYNGKPGSIQPKEVLKGLRKIKGSELEKRVMMFV